MIIEEYNHCICLLLFIPFSRTRMLMQMIHLGCPNYGEFLFFNYFQRAYEFGDEKEARASKREEETKGREENEETV